MGLINGKLSDKVVLTFVLFRYCTSRHVLQTIAHFDVIGVLNCEYREFGYKLIANTALQEKENV